MVGAIALNTMCILPSFLVSAMGENIRSDLHLDEAVLGFAFSGYWLVASVAAYPMAVLADRWGAVRALRAASLGAFALSLAFTGAAHSGAGLVLALAVAGLAPALATPAVNVVIMSGVRVQRRALAFAAASASPVTALMVAGAIAPVLEKLIGWRPAIGIGGLAAALIAVWLREAQPQRARFDPVAPEKVSLRPLMVMMTGVLAGNVALGGATAFAVVAAPTAGLDIASVSVRRRRLCLRVDPVPSGVCPDSRPAGIGPLPRGLDDDAGRRRWFRSVGVGAPRSICRRTDLGLGSWLVVDPAAGTRGYEPV